MTDNDTELRLKTLESNQGAVIGDMRQLMNEIKRIEKSSDETLMVTRSLEKQVSILGEELRIMEQKRLNDKENADRTAQQMEKLTEAINALNETFAEANGKAQGVSMTAKAFWAVAGSVVLASIFWLSGTIVELKSTVAVLQSKLEK